MLQMKDINITNRSTSFSLLDVRLIDSGRELRESMNRFGNREHLRLF